MSEGGALDQPCRRRPTLRISAALTLVLFASVVALAGHAAAADEVEPNDDLASANTLVDTGSYLVNGNAQNATDASDFFRFNLTAAAVVEIVSTPSGCAGAACENLSVRVANGSVLIDPFGDPMEGNDLYFSGLAGSTHYVEVRGGTPGGSYSFSVSVYPFNYASGSRADVSAANNSHAIVALAVGEPKSSVHPYDLTTEGLGLYYGYCMKVFIVNIGPLPLTLSLPAGLIWVSENRNYTSYVVTRDQSVTVPAWQYDSALFIAVTTSPYGWIPGDPSRPNNSPTYFLGGMASGDLRKITDETDAGHYGYPSEQIAVWASEAGQDTNDLTNLGATDAARNEAVTILNRADVHTAINPTSSSWFAWINSVFRYWPFCFAAMFIGFPVLFGLSQVMRVVRVRNMNIDGAYSISRERVLAARYERRAYVREMRAKEKERARARREARRGESRGMQLPPPPVAIPAVAAPPATSAAAETLAGFMALNAEERFDLDRLNALDYNAVLLQAVPSKATAEAASGKAAELLGRLRQDVADPDIIDDILRDRMVKWYRESTTTPEWSAWASHAWSGLVAESRTAGGAKRSPLEKRVSALKEACDAKGKWFKSKAKPGEADASRGKGAAGGFADPAAVKAQVVQAVLDDMHAPKPAATSHPLPILSELAAKLTPQRVNTALAEMFKADPRGPYVVLHPSRYPDADITVIRPPAAGAKAGAMAYEIYFAKAASTAQIPQQTQTGGYVPTGGPVPGLLDTSGALWSRDSVAKEEWNAVLAELQRQRDRLEPPPSNYRKLPPYFTLRELLVTDEAARRAFLGVKWRGKPVGLALLTQLLVDRSLSPDIDTDREYFEAELGDLERGDTSYQSPTGAWTIGGGLKVTRSGDPSQGFMYKV